MRRSRKSSRVAPAPTGVTEKPTNVNKPAAGCSRDPKSPLPSLSTHIRGVASTPIATKASASPPLFDESPLLSSLSPIPFHCTQDGSRGENCVIWDYDSPSSKKSFVKVADPPLKQRNGRVCVDYSPVSRISSKKKQLRLNLVQKNFLDALNEELTALKQAQQFSNSKTNNRSDESNDNNIDIRECSRLSMNDEDSKALENAVQSNIAKLKDAVQYLSNDVHDVHMNKATLEFNDPLSESDNFMNELLIEASQKVEEKLQADVNIIMNLDKNRQDLKNIDNHVIKQTKVNLENVISNDTFDNLLMDINDSFTDNKNMNKDKTIKPEIVESLDSFQIKNITNISKIFDNGNNTIIANNNLDNSHFPNNNVLNESRSKLSRHSSMPMTSNTKKDQKNNNNGGLQLSRHKSMPSNNECENNSSQALSICSAEEIKRKHQAAKEKLLSKKNVVRSNSDRVHTVLMKDINISNIDNLRLSSSFKENKRNSTLFKNIFNDSTLISINKKNILSPSKKVSGNCSKNVNIQEEIERKRKEALERLQRKRSRNLIERS